MLNQAKRLVSELHASNEVPIIAPVSQPNTDKLLGFCEAMLIFPFILTFFFFLFFFFFPAHKKKRTPKTTPGTFANIWGDFCKSLLISGA